MYFIASISTLVNSLAVVCVVIDVPVLATDVVVVVVDRADTLIVAVTVQALVL